MKGDTPENWRTSFYYHYYEFPGWHDVRRHYGVTTGRYKLIHFYEPDVNEWELYDLESDPKEMKSIYGQQHIAKVQEDLHEELKRLRNQYDLPAQDPAASLGGGKDNPNSTRIRGDKEFVLVIVLRFVTT